MGLQGIGLVAWMVDAADNLVNARMFPTPSGPPFDIHHTNLCLSQYSTGRKKQTSAQHSSLEDISTPVTQFELN